MKQLLYLVSLLFLSFDVFAQSAPHWEWGVGDTGVNYTVNPRYPKQLIAAHGNKVLWGEMAPASAVFSTYGAYKLSEYDSAGNQLSVVTSISGRSQLLQAQADSAGNWYILGTYYDTMQVDGGPLTYKSSFTSPDYFIFRLDASTLSLKWFQFIGPSYYSSCRSFHLNGSYLYLAVDSGLNNEILKADTGTGTMVVAASETNGGHLSAVVADENGNMYATGTCPQFGNIILGGHNDSITAAYTAYIVRYKSNGQYDWSIWMNDITCTPRNISLLNNNTIFYSGELNDSLTIGSYSIKKPRILANNYLAASLDSTGFVRWAVQPNDSLATISLNSYCSITTDSTLVIASQVSGNVLWGNGFQFNYGYSSIAAIVAYGLNGSVAWTKYTDCSEATPQQLVSNGWDIWISGNVQDTSAMLLDTISVAINTPGSVPFLAKLKAPLLPVNNLLAPAINNAAEFIKVYPNPATQTIMIKGFEKNAPLSISLSEITGRLIYNEQGGNVQGIKSIDVSVYPRGMYFLVVNTAGKNIIKKLVLQ